MEDILHRNLVSAPVAVAPAVPVASAPVVDPAAVLVASAPVVAPAAVVVQVAPAASVAYLQVPSALVAPAAAVPVALVVDPVLAVHPFLPIGSASAVVVVDHPVHHSRVDEGAYIPVGACIPEEDHHVAAPVAPAVEVDIPVDTAPLGQEEGHHAADHLVVADIPVGIDHPVLLSVVHPSVRPALRWAEGLQIERGGILLAVLEDCHRYARRWIP